MSFEIPPYPGRDGFHFVGRELQLRVGEVHVGFPPDGDEVDVRVGHFQADDGHTDAGAGHGLLDGLGNPLGKEHEAAQGVVVQVEDVIVFHFRHHERMPLGQGVDVEECVIAVVFRYLVGGDFPCDDFAE